MSQPVQARFDDMGVSLAEVTFIVVDLETTGGSPGAHAITEIGAVRVCGGQIEAEFSTLVNPGAVIPAHITMLTGITNAMVSDAPSVRYAVGSFLRWAQLADERTVLVAHNARFDVGHLRQAAVDTDLDWPHPRVVDTLALARKAWSRHDVPNHKLGTLATFVGSPTRPTHRALDDARATVDVLHAAFEALAPAGITHLEDLATATDPIPRTRRAKSHLADDLPTGPGVYEFCSPSGQVLYIGSALNVRRRVRSYFTAAEKRRRVAAMLDTAVQVRSIETPTEIEARVRELRLIAELDPPVNRRSRQPRRQPWLHLVGADGAHPHLASTTVLPSSEVQRAVGPFPSRSALMQGQRAAESVVRLQAWDGRKTRDFPGDLSLSQEVDSDKKETAGCYDLAERVRLVQQALSGQMDLIATPIMERVRRLAAAQRFEEAAIWTERLRCLLAATVRAETARPLLTCPHLIAARRRSGGGWELLCVRWGAFAGSAVTEPGVDPRPAVALLRASATHVMRPERVGSGASVEETILLAQWVFSEGSRLVEVAGQQEGDQEEGQSIAASGSDAVSNDPYATLSWPIHAAAHHRKILESGGWKTSR